MSASGEITYEFVLGIMILVELTVHVRPLRNLCLFRAISDTGGVLGRIEYSRALLLRISSAECFIFSGAFLLLFVLTKSWLILGGVIGCLSIAAKHLKLSRRCRTSAAVAAPESQ
jgi:hypothetical protein